MNAVVNRLLATKKAPQGAFFKQMGDLHNLPVSKIQKRRKETMKKFFSLVLALVMALSLTTVAWGAATITVGATGCDYTTLADAVANAQDGDTIMLKAGTYTGIGPLGGADYSNTHSITIIGEDVDTTIIEGGFYWGYDNSHTYDYTVTIKNITFTGKGLTVADIANVVIDGNKFENISGNAAIAVLDQEYDNMSGSAVITNNVIDGVSGTGVGIEVRNGYDVTITGNTITNTGHNSLQLTKNSALAQNAGTVSIADNTLENWGVSGEGRAMRVNHGTDAGTTAKAVTIEGNVMTHEDAPEEFVKMTAVDTNDTASLSNNYWGGMTPADAGVIADNTAVDTYATSVAADGTVSGLVSAAGVPTTHPANCSSKQVSLKDCALVDLTTGDSHDFAKTDKATLYTFDTITSTVNGVKTTEYGATVYYFDGMYGLVVAKDYANAQLELANGKFVYLRGISAAEFVNASGRTDIVVDSFIDKADVTTKCNACRLDVAVVGEDYYEAEGATLAYYKGEFVLIGDKKAVTDVFTAHAFVDDTNATADCKWNIVDNKFTSVKCACGDSFKVVQSVAGLKSGTYVGTAMNVAGESNWVVLRATTFGNLPSGGTVVTPSTDKVESAETFDAGIAMYVGMSVMAAAGSVVVLKKRED